MRKIYKTENNQIIDVILTNKNFEGSAKDFALEFGLSGEWIDINEEEYFCQPGIGFVYNNSVNRFVSPKPFDSWTLGENDNWEPPTPRPNDEENNYVWNEELQKWEVEE